MERFYYLYLKDALRERGMTSKGISQIENSLPVNLKKDRELAQKFFFDALMFEQRNREYIDIIPEHIRPRFVELGFTLTGITQFYNTEPLSNKADREILLGFLTAYLCETKEWFPKVIARI